MFAARTAASRFAARVAVSSASRATAAPSAAQHLRYFGATVSCAHRRLLILGRMSPFAFPVHESTSDSFFALGIPHPTSLSITAVHSPSEVTSNPPYHSSGFSSNGGVWRYLDVTPPSRVCPRCLTHL
jgi:hypothetical protein